MAKVNVIMTTREGLENTKVSLRSIRENTNHPVRIIDVDDCSTDGTIEYLRGQPDVTLLENEEGVPHGFYKGLQIGMDYERADYYVFSERDAVYTPNWLPKLLEVMQRDQKVGMVTCHANGGPNGQGLPQGAGDDPGNPVQAYWKNHIPQCYHELWDEETKECVFRDRAEANRRYTKMSDTPFFANWMIGHNSGYPKWVPWWLTYEEIMDFGKFVEGFYWRKYLYVGLIWFGHCMVSHKCITEVPLDLSFFRGNGDCDWCWRVTKEHGWKLAGRLDTYCHTQSSQGIWSKWTGESVRRFPSLARLHPKSDEELYLEKYPGPGFKAPYLPFEYCSEPMKL